MSLIFDTANNPISAFSMTLESAEVKTFAVRIDCKTSNYLRGVAVSDLLVEAKLAADAVWTDIETTPIDLTPYNATRQTFDIRITSSVTIVSIRRVTGLTVGV